MVISQVRRIVALIALFGAIGCDGPSESFVCVTFSEVSRFGDAEIDTAGLDAAGVAAGAGVLGQIRAALPTPDGTLLVLDRYWQKVVQFSGDGSVTRVILGGEGRGPGEFRIPIDLTLTDDGFSVLDYDLRRVTEFDWAGVPTSTTQLQTVRPWRHLVRGDTIWVAYSNAGQTAGPTFYRLRRSGEVLDSGPPLPETEQPYGLTNGIVFSSAGETLINTARPGIWVAYSDDVLTRRGTALFPDDPPARLEQTEPTQYRLTPAQHTATGLAIIGDSIVVQGILSYSRPFDWDEPPTVDETRRAIAIFNTSGRHLATLPLPPGATGSVLATEPRRGRVFVDVTEPFPQVVEYAIEPCIEGPDSLGSVTSRT